ncbi:S-adenosyl-L-methionine-dependent methyltransferase [Westerdykella ornata]|uniref:S-adenosyl-L-methionine-dependent methyltransferase n=1 Tax=Westerdykella ornata TaxID=318751 RepID=A0A6A6JV19_WESOR|nr:S-adenosyl-L-methionine-dependent methyltransferase [Westerdykella ornata]KAF2280432.1 S-adenosyl-L-methionine-dependent methyltransferase [Westerdykella ornata]
MTSIPPDPDTTTDTALEIKSRGEEYEAQHVHSVYEEIASHFSSTRYKPWPIVERFLKEQPDGSIGADVGCGNGKYLGVNDRVFIIGSDRSTNLTRIATRHAPHSAIVASILALPHPHNAFDFAISIAVIHHLSTPERRIEAVRCVLELLRRPSTPDAQDGGKALIYVWALEQKESRRGWDEGCEQDVMVPWVMKGKKEGGRKAGRKGRRRRKQGDGDGVGEQEQDEGSEHQMGAGQGDQEGEQEEGQKEPGDKTYLRYYHLYRKGELEHDIEEAGGRVVECGYEKDNWWAIATPKGDT